MNLDAAAGAALVARARAAIAQALGLPAEPVDTGHPDLDEAGACFVTLHLDGRLRGCIGSLTATRPLRDDVVENARAAAFGDPRFPPLTPTEFPRTRIEVSVLSPPVPMPVASRQEARERLTPGVDGVVLEWGGHRATFLPQVWEQLPDPETFLSHLLRKAGLPGDFWADDLRLYQYTVTAWDDGNQEGPP